MIYGLDIGGTKIELAIFDHSPESPLNKIDAWRCPTPRQDYQEFLNVVAEMVEDADAKTAGRGSVGIGMPGFLDAQGCAVSANIPCIRGEKILDALSERLGRPVGLENDVNAFAYSEAHSGAAAGEKHVLGLVLGTGVAGGLCIDAELYHGRQKLAVECGHISMSAALIERYSLPILPCGCGAVGCVEPYLSGPGLLWMCGFFGADYKSTAGLMAAVREGDSQAGEIFAAYMQCLGCYFSELVLIYDPDVIVLGGGLSNIDEIYQNIEAAMQPYLIAGALAPKILPPAFGDSSAVRGAALIGHTAMINHNKAPRQST